MLLWHAVVRGCVIVSPPRRVVDPLACVERRTRARDALEVAGSLPEESLGMIADVSGMPAKKRGRKFTPSSHTDPTARSTT